MNTQVPTGSFTAVSSQESPQFAAGYASYPPAHHATPHHAAAHHTPAQNAPAQNAPVQDAPAWGHHPHHPVSAPPAGYPAGDGPTTDYPAVRYPQQGAAGYPVPVPYPQPGLFPAAPADHAAAAPAPTAPWTGPQPADHTAAATTGTAPWTAAQPAAATTATAPWAAAQPAAATTATAPWAATQPAAATTATAPWAAIQPANHAAAQHTAVDPGAAAGGLGEPPEQSFPQHGGLLVPFPDEMRHAARAQAPAVWPVAVFTLLFGIVGAVSANRRAGQARRTRNSAAPYWLAFLVSAAGGAFCWFVLSAVVIEPMVTEVRENSRLEAVQRNVVGDGQLRNARISVTTAQCQPVTERDAEGRRDYLCRLTLEGGRTGTLALTADESGQWSSAPAR